MTDHPDLLKTFMTRSGHLPVSLFPGSFGSEPQFTIPLLSLLEEAATRIQHMNLRLTKRLLRDLLETRHFGRTEEEGNLPMLESLNLYYPNLFNEANDPPPTIFWFVSDAALPRLHTLKAVGFRWSFHRMLIRSTLTRLSLNPSDEGSLRRWLRLLKNTPLLEELELDTIFGDSDIEDQEIPANARISMPCLRRVVLGEFGSGELVAGLINHLDIPTNCVISLHATDDRQCITAATHSFVLSVVGSKMGTTFSSPAWQPRSMNLHISCTCSTIAFWPHVYHPFSNAARDGYDSDDSDEESAEAPILQCKLHYKSTDVSGLVASLRAGTLPLQALQSLSIDNSGGIDETIWVLLIRCPKLRYLSVTSSTTHRALLALLADPVFLPSLRSLRLKGACWGTKPGLGDSPPEGEAFSVSLERMLVARKDAGRPLVGLVLDSIADLKSEDDRTWLDGPCRRLGTNLVVLVPGRYN
ncbi:hypothetical protein PsYK624_062970 [Phanerochaete sordida]|uniref:F-box domain-containing protein n=1 Tax=Phanerochaete sordida TaxID=48140 RepID=A0A9P3G8C7_9APHY|nr:hypothetical protein PsYK624_062970 [Phanerochaete sordida]